MTWEKDDTKFGTDDFKKPEEGALPTLDDNTVLGSPETQTKSKTNVGKLAVLGIFLAGFIFIVVGLLIYQKNKKSGAYGGATATEKARPGFAEKNAEVQSDSIDSTKAELKKKQEEEEARLRAIEEEQKRLAEEERLRLEEERATGRRQRRAFGIGGHAACRACSKRCRADCPPCSNPVAGCAGCGQ